MVISDEIEQGEHEVNVEVEDDEIDDFELYVVEIEEIQDILRLEIDERLLLMCIDLF